MKEYYSILHLASRWNSKKLRKSDKIKEGRMSKSRLQLVVYDIWHSGGGFCQSWHLSSLFNKVLVLKYPKYQYLNCFPELWFRKSRRKLLLRLLTFVLINFSIFSLFEVIKYHYIKSCVAGGCFYTWHFCNNDPAGDTISQFYQAILICLHWSLAITSVWSLSVTAHWDYQS